MKTHLLLVLSGILVLAVSPASAGDAPASSPATTAADHAWEELQSLDLLNQSARPANFAGLTERGKRAWFERRALQLRDKGMAFYESFSTDPRRWTVAWQLITIPPGFITSYGPNADDNFDDVTVDKAAASAWQAKLAELEAAMAKAQDVPTELREGLDWRSVERVIAPTFSAAERGTSVDWKSATASVLDFAAKYPESLSPAAALRNYTYSFEQAHPPVESARLWRSFVNSPNRQLAEMAQAKVRAFESLSVPMELSFTAIDGREVDLKKLRGKVVLVDFWATWCGPCLAEMPTVKKVYQAYHEKGFEIVGISCDVAPERAKGNWVKLARTAPQVLEFATRNGMLWPEHYEGRKHNEGGNSIAARFAVTGIPGSFLLDRTGNVVGINLRGKKLETEVKRLLSTPPFSRS